jgi:hypothetical protein
LQKVQQLAEKSGVDVSKTVEDLEEKSKAKEKKYISSLAPGKG